MAKKTLKQILGKRGAQKARRILQSEYQKYLIGCLKYGQIDLERNAKMDIQIAQEICCNCNIVFWLTAEHQRRLKSCHNGFYCPNGHFQSYKGQTDAQKIARLKEKLRYEKQCSESLTRSNSALRGVITKNKRK